MRHKEPTKKEIRKWKTEMESEISDYIFNVDSTIALCRIIKKVYGHTVDPRELAELIETSELHGKNKW